MNVCKTRLNKTMTSVFSRKIVVKFLAANLITLLPFVFWLGISPAWLRDDVASVSQNFSFDIFFYSFYIGVIFCLIGSLFIGIPTIIRLGKKKETSLKSWLFECSLWFFAACYAFGIYGLFSWNATSSALSAVVVSFFLFLLPVYLSLLTYWYLSVRESPRKGVLILLSLAFLLWNFECSFFVAVLAAD